MRSIFCRRRRVQNHGQFVMWRFIAGENQAALDVFQDLAVFQRRLYTLQQCVRDCYLCPRCLCFVSKMFVSVYVLKWGFVSKMFVGFGLLYRDRSAIAPRWCMFFFGRGRGHRLHPHVSVLVFDGQLAEATEAKKHRPCIPDTMLVGITPATENTFHGMFSLQRRR